jgi:hypothetical protein
VVQASLGKIRDHISKIARAKEEKKKELEVWLKW